MLDLISNKLKEKNIFHKVKDTQIVTKKSKVRIPNINEEIAYLTGVIAGDGTLTTSKRKRGGNYYELKIYANSTEYLDLLNNLIKEYFLIQGRITKDKRKQNTYLLAIKNAVVYWYFEILNAKYRDSNIPKFCDNKELFNHYLAGLIDTDGSVSKNRIQLKLKDRGLIKKIYQNIQEANPNQIRINYTNRLPFYYIRFNNIFPLRWKTNNFKNHKLSVL